MTDTTTHLTEVLTTLNGGQAGPFVLRDQDDEPLHLSSLERLDALLEAEPEPYVDPMSDGLVRFVYQVEEAGFVGEWTSLTPAPSVVLTKGQSEARFYVLDQPQPFEVVEPLAALMGCDLTVAAPLPGSNGWAPAHDDAKPWLTTATFSVEDLESHFDDTPAVVAPVAAALGKHRDATIRTVFDFQDPRLTEPVVITGGANRKSVDWKPSEMTRGAALDIFCRHNVSPNKDGPGVVLGSMKPGRRLNEAVEEMWFAGLDFDSGITGDTLAEAIAETGLMAVMASTHSHMKTTTIESLSSLQNWLTENGREGEEITQAVVRQRMAEKGLETEIVATMEFEIVGSGEGQDVVITHAPVQKWRVIFPLSAPFVIADHATDDEGGHEVWRRVPRALARRLGGLPFDHACVDVNRLWYLPAHPVGAEFRVDLFGGDLLDVDAILTETTDNLLGDDRVSASKNASRERAQDPDKVIVGPFDRRWAARRANGLDIVGLLKAKVKNDRVDKKLRGQRGDKLTIRCPFNADHSNSRDKTDAGCFAVSAGDGRGDGFNIHCSHGSCKSRGRDRLDYLNKMVEDGWFSAEDVEAFDLVLREEPVVEEEVDVEAALTEYVGIAGLVKAGNVAVSSALHIDAVDPSQCLFDGPNAEAEAIEAMSKVASVVSLGNKVRIATRTKDGLTFNVKSDAALWFSSYRVLLEVGEDKQGNPRIKEFSALDLLLKSDRVKRYAGIDCDPTCSLPDHVLNTWEGIAIAPAPGDCSLLKKHLLESTCAGNADHYKVLTQFFGHMFQKPGEKPGFAPVVIGPRGAGKSTVADFLRRAIGRKHSVKISQGKHLTGSFNAHLAGRLFVQAEEVTFGGDKRGEGPLKDAITSPTTLTEPKGFDAYEETSFARFFLVTNPGHAVPAGDGERRWFVLKVRDLFDGTDHDDPRRIAYFEALRAEADNGGIAAFLHYLVNEVDISDFKPWAPPKTEALAEQVLQSLSDEDRWVMDVLENGAFNGRDGYDVGGGDWELDEPLVIDRVHVQASFDSYVRSHNGSSGGNGAARRALLAHGEVVDGRRSSGDRKKTYRLAPRREWRERFEARFGITLAGE
nr:DUF5906 domain-containing protein [Brevundimonas diminuta]